MGSISAAFVIAGLLACSVPALCIQNAVVEWQDILEQVVRDYNISNQHSAQYYALSNLAQHQVHTSPIDQPGMNVRMNSRQTCNCREYSKGHIRDCREYMM